MRRNGLFILVSGLIGCCVVAIVRAQGPGDSPGAPTRATESGWESRVKNDDADSRPGTPQVVLNSATGSDLSAQGDTSSVQGQATPPSRLGTWQTTVIEGPGSTYTATEVQKKNYLVQASGAVDGTSRRPFGTLADRLKSLRQTSQLPGGLPTVTVVSPVQEKPPASDAVGDKSQSNLPESLLPTGLNEKQSSRRDRPNPREPESSGQETRTDPVPQKAATDRATGQTEVEGKLLPGATKSDEGATESVSDNSAAIPRESGSESEELLLSGKSAALNVVTTGPRTVIVGKQATYVVHLSNSVATTAKSVTVVVNIPHSADIVGTKATVGDAHFEASGDYGNRVRWTIDRFAGHGREQLELTLLPQDSRSFELSVEWAFQPERTTAQIEVREPKLELSIHGPSDVLYGQTKVYSLKLSNPGSGDAENVVVHLLPIGPEQKVAGIRKLGTIKAGESKRIDVELVAEQAGQIIIRAQAFASGGLRVESVEEVLVRRADLAVEIEAPEMKYAGTVTNYSIRVSNTGDASADNVVALAQLPPGAEFLPRGSSPPATVTDGHAEWNIGQLLQGDSRTVKFSCVLNGAGPNRIEVVSRAADGLAAMQTAVTAVEAMADLKLVVNDPQGPLSITEDAKFEIQIINRGTKAAKDIRVFAFFSEGIEPILIEGGRAHIEPGQAIFQPIDRLSAGQNLVYQITARATVSGNHNFRVELECSDPESKLASQETTRFYGDIPVGESSSRSIQRRR